MSSNTFYFSNSAGWKMKKQNNQDRDRDKTHFCRNQISKNSKNPAIVLPIQIDFLNRFK